MQIQIETVNICDAACVFCPYKSMTRPKAVMPMQLFKKIIDDAATIPPIDKVTLNGLGEPLLDKHLMERLAYVRKRMNIKCLDLYTNGNRLTLDIVRDMMKMPVDMLYVSLNAVDDKARKQVMGVDGFERLAETLDKAIAITKKSKMMIVVKGVVGTDLMEFGDADAFVKRWGGNTSDGGNAFLHLEGNWAGTMYKSRFKHRNCCHRIIDQIMVLADGRVSLCCFDGDGEVIFGDLNAQSIRDIYNNGLALEYREAHMQGRRSEMTLCADCTSI